MEIKPIITASDFNAICRLCLMREHRLQPIFTNPIGAPSINQMISICFGLQIRPDDGLPVLICVNCLSKVIDNHSFRIQCINADDFLKTLKLKTENDINLFDNDWFVDGNDDIELKTDTINEPIKIDAIFSQNFNEAKEEHNFEDMKPEIESIENPPKSSRTKSKRGRPKATGKPKERKKLGRPRTVQSLAEKRKRNKDHNAGICTVCGKKTSNIYTHARVHSDNSITFECDYCQKTFTNKFNLQLHFKIHFNQRNHQCTLCPYKFVQRTHLMRHMMTHTGEKPHKCNSCSRRFAQLSALKTHEKRHFQNREVSCPYCDKMFLTVKNLKSHIGIHTGERPFKCDMCDAAFIASSTLAVHRKTHKKENVNLNQCNICQMILEDRIMLRSHLRDHGINELKVKHLEIMNL